jgi:hypothetical protein
VSILLALLRVHASQVHGGAVYLAILLMSAHKASTTAPILAANALILTGLLLVLVQLD